MKENRGGGVAGMAIKKTEARPNKFEAAVAQLDAAETEVQSRKVVKAIAGSGVKRGRRAGQSEQRKVLPTYIPMSLYEEFDAVTKAYGISNNAAICQLIREYVNEKKGQL